MGRVDAPVGIVPPAAGHPLPKLADVAGEDGPVLGAGIAGELGTVVEGAGAAVPLAASLDGSTAGPLVVAVAVADGATLGAGMAAGELLPQPVRAATASITRKLPAAVRRLVT